MAYGTRVKFAPVREVDYTSISSSYIPLGTPLGEHVRIINFNNGTDQDLYISFDQVNNILRLAKNSFKLLDLSANKVRDDGLFLSASTQIYVKQVSASLNSGTLWVEVMYAEGGV
jgi:hypothetical protein